MASSEQTARAYSWSQMNSFSRCPEAYRRRYIEGHRIPPSIAMARGTAVHKGAEVNEVQKIESHEDLPAREVVEISIETFRENSVSEGLAEKEVHPAGVYSKKVGEGIDQIRKLARLYIEDVAPLYQPIAAELPITVDAGEIKISMVIDTITDGDVIRDRKTMGQSPSIDSADRDIQLSLNALGFYGTYKKLPAAVILDALVDTKVAKHVECASERTAADLQSVISRINVFHRAIEAGIFVPTTDTKMICAPHLCGYWRTCQYAAKR